jgi:hypothetical protein
MKIMIEQYGYDKERLSKLLDPHYFTELRDGKAKIPYVGYFLSRRIPDVVFILPKVFIIDGKAFGEYEPEEIIDFDKLKQEHQANVFSLSVWVYRAIKHYFQRKDKYGEEAEIMQNVVSHQGPRSETMIDIILSLLKFDKEHKNLFSYVTRLKHSGLNKIHWQKTISNTQALIQNGTPVYLNPHTKQKAINFDEELIVLFYSVLNYLNREFKFNVRPAFGYELLKPDTIQSMIDSGKGIRILRQNRRKYFTDEMVQLWNLLFTFFEQSQYVQSKDNDDEQAMLVREFNLVFEDMIDSLIGDSDIRGGLKEQKDGKIIDHIYRDSSLIEDKKQIYFIGDSKYYKDDNDIGPNSIYKQFTYAKNVIQYNIDFFNRAPEEFERENLQYRDNTTEGYNITPNFFIRGHLHADQLNNYTDDNLQLVKIDGKNYRISYHFENRLFDRDTLILQTYNINFLFVLACYVQGAGEHTQKIRSIFRDNIKSVLQSQYNFFAIKPKVQDEAEQFLHDNFQQVLGKVFAPYATTTNCMALALDQDSDNSETLRLIDKYFYRKPIPQNELDTDPDTLFTPKEQTTIRATAAVEEDAWVLLIERSASDEDMLNKVYPQLTKAQYIAVGIGLSAGAIDAEPALLSAKFVVVHNKRFGRMSCLAGKAKFVMSNVVDDKFFIAKGKGSELYVAYEIDHSTQPPIISTNADILRLSEHNGYDTRFVKLSELY